MVRKLLTAGSPGIAHGKWFCPARLVLQSECSSGRPLLPPPRPGRPPSPRSASQTGHCTSGRGQPLSPPERHWGDSGGSGGGQGGCTGAAAGSGGKRVSEGPAAPRASWPDSVPGVQGHHVAVPGRDLSEGEGAQEGGRPPSAALPPAERGHLLPLLAGCSGTRLDFPDAPSSPRA